MNSFKNILTLTGVANGEIPAYALVDFNDMLVDADDQPVKGVALNPANDGDAFAINAIGVCQVIATGVIQSGHPLVSAADAGVKKAADDAVNVFAVALTDAANGELVSILIR